MQEEDLQKKVQEAEYFVNNRTMTRKEIKLVRKMLKVGRFIPGIPKLSPAARVEVDKILAEKEKVLNEKNKL